MKKYIIVAGNIGVGKSTLVRLLCERLGWRPFFEPEVENPYLSDFYRDMPAWAFHSQVFFLAHRLRIHLQIQRGTESAIQDRSLYEDAEIFAYGLYLQGALSERDYATYRALYQAACDCLTPPDLMIYLRASTTTLQQRIAQRRRPYEREIPADYLERLNHLYEAWVAGFTLCPVLTVPADDLDYVARPGHFELILQKVQEKLTGKEEVRFSPAEVASHS